MSSTQADAPRQYSRPVLRIIAALQLGKVPLCMLISCSAGFGALLVPDVSVATVLTVSCSVLLLATGGATINSLQEVDVDQTMQRTASRPLVRKLVSKKFAVLQAIILVATGLFTLSTVDKPGLVIALATLALIIYNGVYTPLKQRTILAIVPGAVCGGLPPLIGWSGGGGELLSYMALLLFTLLFLWQIPHFCLILLRHKDDYHKAKQPSFLPLLTENGVRKLSIVWICGLALVMMLFSVTPAPVWEWQRVLLVLNGALLAGVTLLTLTFKRRYAVSYRTIFVALNAFLLSHMVILSIGVFFSL